jgi:hypothetical protein
MGSPEAVTWWDAPEMRVMPFGLFTSAIQIKEQTHRQGNQHSEIENVYHDGLCLSRKVNLPNSIPSDFTAPQSASRAHSDYSDFWDRADSRRPTDYSVNLVKANFHSVPTDYQWTLDLAYSC